MPSHDLWEVHDRIVFLIAKQPEELTFFYNNNWIGRILMPRNCLHFNFWNWNILWNEFLSKSNRFRLVRTRFYGQITTSIWRMCLFILWNVDFFFTFASNETHRDKEIRKAKKRKEMRWDSECDVFSHPKWIQWIFQLLCGIQIKINTEFMDLFNSIFRWLNLLTLERS